MRTFVLAGSALLSAFGIAAGQDPVAPPTLMKPFTGTKPPAAVPGSLSPNAGRVTLTPLFEMPKMSQPRPAPGMELKPEHGEWVIEIKSYAQVEAGLMAQVLAQEIRETHKAAAYLFEYGAEIRAKRDTEEAEARRRMEEELKPFFKLQAELKAEAEAEGREFIETPLRSKVPVYYKEIPDQYMVVLGGFKDLDAARKGLDAVRRWPMPGDKRLLDSVETSVVRDGKKVFETSSLNPYAEAKVVRNLTWPKQAVAQRDDFLIKLNEGEPYSILKSPKSWTIMVHAFNVPVSKAGAETQSNGAGRGPLAGLGFGRTGRWLDATAQQAKDFCEVLRKLKTADGRDVSFDAHLMHHRTGTIVTVGQYDGPDDPKLLDDLRRVVGMTKNLNENKNNAPGAIIKAQTQMFGCAYPMPIPK